VPTPIAKTWRQAFCSSGEFLSIFESYCETLLLINSKRNLRKANRNTQLQSTILLRVVSLLSMLYSYIHVLTII
jgi:hypothetical protein